MSEHDLSTRAVMFYAMPLTAFPVNVQVWCQGVKSALWILNAEWMLKHFHIFSPASAARAGCARRSCWCVCIRRTCRQKWDRKQMKEAAAITSCCASTSTFHFPREDKKCNQGRWYRIWWSCSNIANHFKTWCLNINHAFVANPVYYICNTVLNSARCEWELM